MSYKKDSCDSPTHLWTNTKRIFSERDISLLEDWMRMAIEADTVEAFLVRTGLDRII